MVKQSPLSPRRLEEQAAQYGSLSECKMSNEVIEPPSTLGLLLAASCMGGIFTMWSFEYAIAVPYFVSVLGFRPEVASAMWVAGPISGLLVGPVVGVLSDRCTSPLGRRRPFILLGVSATLVSAAIYAGAPWLSGDNPDLARVLAAVSFCMMDLAINTVQNPARALLSDIAGPDRQVAAQAAAAFLCGFGYMLGYAIVFLTSNWRGHIFEIYTVGCLILVCSTAITVFTARERPSLSSRLPEAAAGSGGGASAGGVLGQIGSIFTGLWRGVATMPPAVRQIAVCQALCWFGWFCFSQLLTQFFGESVFGGDSRAVCFTSTDGQLCKPPACNPCTVGNHTHACADLCAYQSGVTIGTLALFCQNIVTICVSAAFAFLLQGRVEPRISYRVTLGVQAAMFFALSLKHDDPNQAVFFVAATGIAQAGTQVFPYALVGSAVSDPESKGLAIGVLTLCIVIPQFLDTTYVGMLGAELGQRWVIFLGGCFALAAFVAAEWLPNETKAETKEDDYKALPG